MDAWGIAAAVAQRQHMLIARWQLAYLGIPTMPFGSVWLTTGGNGGGGAC